MSLNKEQDEALVKINEWLKDPNKWEFRLGGYAGTGKTFLLQHFINSYEGNVTCCTPTGKAAAVLSIKLNGHSVQTIHSLLYRPVQVTDQDVALYQSMLDAEPENEVIQKMLADAKAKMKVGQVGFIQKDEHGIQPGQLLIVDESSMVTAKMYDDIKATKCKALFVGDPGQLPPVKGGDWFIKGDFGYILQDAQRQALDSPILRLALAIRTGAVVKADYQFDNCRIVDKDDFDKGEWDHYQQVLTGKNFTRHSINRFMRTRKFGKEANHLPYADEKMAFQKNEDRGGINITNGLQFLTASDYRYDDDKDQYLIDVDFDGIKLEDMPFHDFHCRANYNDKLVDIEWRLKTKLREIDYAYAITVHKSQGSEWESVILADDSMNKKDTDFRRRWVYTAVTRAKNRLVWIKQ